MIATDGTREESKIGEGPEPPRAMIKPNDRYDKEEADGTPIVPDPKLLQIKSELSNDFKFTEGSVGFARATEFDTEDSEFFITLKEIPIYQGEYTPIGKVVYGLDILTKIKTGNKAIYVLRPDYINTFRMFKFN